jgi:HAMP domain-containing protein
MWDNNIEKRLASGDNNRTTEQQRKRELELLASIVDRR